MIPKIDFFPMSFLRVFFLNEFIFFSQRREGTPSVTPTSAAFLFREVQLTKKLTKPLRVVRKRGEGGPRLDQNPVGCPFVYFNSRKILSSHQNELKYTYTDNNDHFTEQFYCNKHRYILVFFSALKFVNNITIYHKADALAAKI